MTPEENLRIYEQDVNAEANIRDAITKAYQDLKPESELVHTYENAQFPSFYDTLSGYGTGAADMSPTARLANAWGEVGRRSTSANVARDAFDVRKAGMEDLIKTGVGQWATGYQGAQNAYDRWWAQKQHEDQMALAREQMRRSSLNPSPVAPTQGGLTPEQEAELRAVYEEERRYNENVNTFNNYIKPLMQKEQTNRANDGWANFGRSLQSGYGTLSSNYNEVIKPNISSFVSNIFKKKK
jgi:hypothetical protein